ncbi:MAG TPA: class I SAM-dependent RNA methyltransferase [Halanaerobiales bacterium]|nr:class I SAM-dependent RNA methyltransferase [Halanaerobiales bacterium]
MTEFELIATTTFGLEALVKEELKEIGYKPTKVENGRITFRGPKEAIARVNIYLRCAERVLLKMGEFIATDFDELYDQTRELPWSDFLTEDAEFPVTGKSARSQLHSVSACQSIIKKAVVDNLKKEYQREWFEENGSLFSIRFSLINDRVILSIDTSGEGLHKRGYRELVTDSPLQETLAAAMIKLSRWDGDRILIDPFTGSGTIPIEAAMLGKRIAPGLKRRFIAEKWPFLNDTIWNRAREEARSMIKKDYEPRLIIGNDIDNEVIGIARHHARKAEVEELIHFQKKDFVDFQNSRKYGYIITNPPYGERSGKRETVDRLYRDMGKKLLPLDTWSFYILTSYPEFETLFGKKASKRRKLYNGGIECQYYQYYGPWPPRDKNSLKIEGEK